MNDRLYEIINQCFIGTTDGKLSELNTVKNVEKFAELIIKECSVALSPMLRDMVSRGQAYDLIRQHFGVEE
jgi:hypothetical protein